MYLVYCLQYGGQKKLVENVSFVYCLQYGGQKKKKMTGTRNIVSQKLYSWTEPFFSKSQSTTDDHNCTDGHGYDAGLYANITAPPVNLDGLILNRTQELLRQRRVEEALVRKHAMGELGGIDPSYRKKVKVMSMGNNESRDKRKKEKKERREDGIRRKTHRKKKKNDAI